MNQKASKYNIKHIIKFDKEIGGRYSIWSDISVPAFLDSTFEPDNF
jgi:glucose-6-phosphate isomerase